MRNIVDCVNAFLPLLNTEYELILGRKGVAVTLCLTFDKKDCFHLMGLQYLIDRPELKKDRGTVFDEIVEGNITTEHIETSDFYHKIAERVHFLPLLERLIDSNETVFKYNQERMLLLCLRRNGLDGSFRKKICGSVKNKVSGIKNAYARNAIKKT